MALASERAVLLSGPAPNVPIPALSIRPEPTPEEIAAIAAVMAAAVTTAEVSAQIETLPKWRRAARNYNDEYDLLRAARRRV